MPPITKENDVLTAAPDMNSSNSAAGARLEDTASRPQPVALEVPVTVNGARTVDGSDKREPFSETTKTVLVFGNGAVIRLGSPVAAGQLLFLTNEKTKKEVVCQVVKSKNYRSVSGYVELEFTEPVVGFWGMRFPSDRIASSTPAPAATVLPAAKGNPLAPTSPAPKIVSPVSSVSPKVSELKPVPIQSPAKPSVQLHPVEAKVVTPALPKPVVPSVPAVTPSEVAPASSLASSLTSLLGSTPQQSAHVPSSPVGTSVPPQHKLEAASSNSETEQLKLQAARLQEQLSSMLFSATQQTKPGTVAPSADSKTVSNLTTKVLEIARSEPVPVKSVPPAKVAPPPVKSSLDTEEVKIPSWLEPLARNAAASASTQELIEREKTKNVAEVATSEELSAEPVPLAEVESASAPAPELPAIGSLLPLDEEALPGRSSKGSKKGLFVGLVAAALLLVGGGAWYLLHPTNAVQGTSVTIARPSNISNAVSPTAQPATTQPEVQPTPQNAVEPSKPAPPPSVSQPISSEPPSKSPVNSQPAQSTRDSSLKSATPIQAAEKERIARTATPAAASPATAGPAAEPQPKKPALGEVHLASPMVNRRSSSQEDATQAPTLATGADVPNMGGLDSGLGSGSAKEPAAPDAPRPVGGDVKPAKLINSVSPTYPAIAKNQHITGNVVIDALIDANGRVTTMKVISGPPLLHQAATDALRQWKYQPASLDGNPVSMHLTVTLQFRMQ